jgi:hypothetical protein
MTDHGWVVQPKHVGTYITIVQQLAADLYVHEILLFSQRLQNVLRLWMTNEFNKINGDVKKNNFFQGNMMTNPCNGSDIL